MRKISIKVGVASYIILFWMLASLNISYGYPTGQLANVTYDNQRMWGAWVASDANDDGWREIVVCGAIYTRCIDINPAHGGPVEIWNQWGLHHEVQWGCDSGIDVNNDDVTEQLVFEAVWNNHYLLDGKNGSALESNSEEHRRSGLYWPSIDCGTGLNGIDVNGNGIPDYVITGVNGGYGPILRCVEGLNGSTIWEKTIAGTPNGVFLVTANNSLRIMTCSSEIELWYPNGTACGNFAFGTPAIIPNWAGPGHDGAVIGNIIYNISSGLELLTSPITLMRTFYCGDVNNDGIGDYGGLYPDGKKVALMNGNDGMLIRNHTAKDLENYMHGIIGVGDLNNDGYDDYGIFGDFALSEIFSGSTGESFLQIQSHNGVEELYHIPDVNGNGYADIMTFNGGATVIDGSSRGLVVVETTNVNPIMMFVIILSSIALSVIVVLSIALIIVVRKNRKLSRK